MLAALAVTEDNVQLFEYVSPTDTVQIDYMVAVAKQVFMRERWDRNFDGEACPETSVLICKKPEGCDPIVPPPPDVCDLPGRENDPECNPDPTCIEEGNCPIPICEVPVNVRVVEDGIEKCEKDYCKVPENKDDPRCKPVDLCDLKFYADHLDKCKELPPQEPKCKTNPDLCVTICDLTGDYSPCAYEICKVYTFLPHCNPVDPPKVCEDQSVSELCCEGEQCTTEEKKCEWAWKVGAKTTSVSDPIFTNKSRIDKETGQIFLECLNEVDVTETKDIIFECFKEGVEMGEGWIKTTKDKLLDLVHEYKGDGTVTQMEIDDEAGTGSATITNEKREELEF